MTEGASVRAAGRVWRGARRAGSFGATVVVSGVTGILAVPFVISYAGENGWGAIAVGQSLGAVLSVFTLLGWSQAGPAEVARADRGEASRLFFESVYVRGVAFLVVSAAAFPVAAVLKTGAPLATALAAIAQLTVAAGAQWFYVGESRPLRLLCFDTVPRAAALATATALLALGAPLPAYSAVTAAGGLVAVAAASADVARRYGRPGRLVLGPRRVARILAGHRHGIGTAVLSMSYLSFPVILVQLVDSGALPLFALADRIRQQALTAYRPISQVLQGWTPRGAPAELPHRVVIAWRVSAALGAVGFAGGALLIPPVSRLLGAGALALGPAIAVPIALAFGSAVMSTSVGVSCLVPLGLERHITVSALLGTVLVLGLMLGLTDALGAAGAALGLAASQATVAGYQSLIVWRALRRRRRGPGR